MKRKLITLSLAAMAIAIVSVVSASAASAAPLFHAESEPVTFKGTSSDNTFVTDAGEVACETSSFSGVNTAKTSTTATLTPVYSGCKAFGFIGATVEPNGCSYVFHLVEGSSPPTATVDIECPSGKEITITAATCTVHVPPQTGLSHVVFTNEGAKATRDIKAAVTVGGIHYTATSGCIATGTRTNGVYSGTVTVKGFNSGGAQQGIWVE